MFEDFTFDQKKVSPADSISDKLDLESNLSPIDVPTDRPSSQSQFQSQSQAQFQFTPQRSATDCADATHSNTIRPVSSVSTSYPNRNYDSQQIDSLTQQMGRQTLLSYYRSSGTLRAVPQFEDPETGYTLPMPGLSFKVPAPSNPLPQAPASQHGDNALLPYKLVVDSTPQPAIAPGAVPYRRAGCTSRLQYKLLPSQSDAPNTRAVRAELMEKMIKYGVQCKVQPSMPKPPPSLGQPTTSGQATEIEGNLDIPMLDADGPSERSDTNEAGVLGTDEKGTGISLRQAGAPSRIQYRRAGGNLVCSSAADVALRSKNLRRSEVRMRRRSSNKQKPAPPLAPAPVEPIQLPTPPPEAEAASPAGV